MIIHYLMGISISLLAGGAAFAAPPEESVAKAYENAANLNEASFVTEIVFKKDSSELSNDGRNALRDMLKAAKDKGKVEEVKILAWADKDYPPKNKMALNKDERKLADERALEIKGYVEDNSKGVDIDVHNMAERPYTLQNLFKSGDLRVKKSLETAGLSNPSKSGMPSKSGRVLVMVIVQ